jgi:hypothetical protein
MIDPSQTNAQLSTADRLLAPRRAHAGGASVAPSIHRSLQPTPEAAKSRVARLRRKQRLLIKKKKRALLLNLNRVPPAPDPLSP